MELLPQSGQPPEQGQLPEPMGVDDRAEALTQHLDLAIRPADRDRIGGTAAHHDPFEHGLAAVEELVLAHAALILVRREPLWATRAQRRRRLSLPLLALLEPVDAALGVDDPLLAAEEGMAYRADLGLELFLRRAGGEPVATETDHDRVVVVRRVDSGFHWGSQFYLKMADVWSMPTPRAKSSPR